MKTKGIAIHTILLLVVGLIAVGVIAYVVYTSFTGSTLGREECRARLISYCTSCQVAGWTGAGPSLDDLADECCNKYFGSGFGPTYNCDESKVIDLCRGFIPGMTTTT